jgi:hypothetical protein
MAIIGFITGIIVSLILRGWIFCNLWSWFVVPVFGLQELFVVQGMGLALVASYLTYHTGTNKNSDVKMKDALVSILFNFIVLGIGYIIHLFM